MAQLTKSRMVEFRTKQLNIFCKDEASEWIPRKNIEALMMSYPREQFKDFETVCSVDLSVSDDFSAVSYLVFTPTRVLEGKTTNCPFHSYTDYYFPEGQLEKHPNKELYKRWVEQGHLKLCKGSVIDYDMIVEEILSQPFMIIGLGYDPYKSLEFVRTLERSVGEGYLFPISQTYGNFTSPVEMLEIGVYNENLTFDDNPITAYCFDNAVIDEDRLENRKPIKVAQNKKIDGAITNVMNMWLRNNWKQKD